MPNLTNVIITIITGLCIQNLPINRRKQKIIFLSIVWVCLTFVAGMRGLYALGDTDSYYYVYMDASKYSLSQYTSTLSSDPLYYMLSWSFARSGIPWQVYLCIVSGFVFAVFECWIYLYSESPLMSMLIFECLFLQVWQGSLRQSIAMALCLLSYISLRNQKRLLGLLLLAFATGFHGTALVFLIYYCIRRIPINSITIGIMTVATFICYLFRSTLLQYVNMIANSMDRNTYTEFYAVNPTTLIALCVIILVAFLIVRKIAIENYPDCEQYYSALFLMIALLALGGGVVVRLSWYTGLFICLIIPIICYSVTPIVLAETIAAITLLYFYSNSVDINTWYFFWQSIG